MTDRPENRTAIVDALTAENSALRQMIAEHPGWAADVTFAAIWKWLDARDRILSKPPVATVAEREKGGAA